MSLKEHYARAVPAFSRCFAVAACLLCMPFLAAEPAPDTEALRAAIAHLGRAYGPEYPDAARYLDRLRRLRESGATPGVFAAFQREALLAHPVLRKYPVLFVTRRQYKPDHHNTATMFQVGEVNEHSFEGGGALKTIDFARGGVVTTLLEAPEGIIRDPEVHFGGTRIIFSMRDNPGGAYHIHTCNADGSEVRRLTSAPGVSDIDPLFLPGDSIVFSSTREPKYCMCNQHIMANLFRMDADGANIHQIGKSTLFEGHGALLPDGRILYDRWEYVDRNFGDAQGLWTVFPDGTGHAVYYGNYTWSPGGVIDARPIPGTDRVVCILGSCHDRPWGAMAILDRNRGIDGREPILRTWPAPAIELVEAANGQEGYGFDRFVEVQPKYEDPFPLDAHFFLCSRATGEGEAMGMYLADTFGNEVLLHFEAPGVFDPMPLAPSPRPPVIPSRRDLEQREGYIYVADVYEGPSMAAVPRGTVRRLRVVESPEKRFFTHPAWEGQGVHRPAMNWHGFENKRILGTAPVEPDGSAYVAVPPDTFLYFQLLDEAGMMVQSMRSGTIVQPGERLGCAGCHEHRHTAPPARTGEVPLALLREPSRLEAWHGPARLFSYRQEVQPVFDAHCVRCHDFGKEAGDKLNLAGDRDLTFNASYVELWRKGYTGAVGAGPADLLPAYAWGSHASKLVATLRAGHQDVALDAEAMDRIVTWVDLNAPYYPVYASAYPDNLAGRSPLDVRQVRRLADLTGAPFEKLAGHQSSQGPQVSFDRPESSPCLGSLEQDAPEAYAEALEIIRAGAQALAAVPRGDDPEFNPAPPDKARELRYALRQRAGQRARDALLRGDRVYD